MNKIAPLFSLPLLLALLVTGCGDLATEPEPRASGNALKGETSAPPSLRGAAENVVAPFSGDQEFPPGEIRGQPDLDGHPNVGVIGFDLDGPEGPLPPFALCTAFVASDSIVITAGHCIPVAPDAAWAVTFEAGSESDPVVDPGVIPDDSPFPILVPVVYADEVVMHPRFGEGHRQANDVAVLQFPEDTFDDVSPVDLPRERELDELAAQGGLPGQEFTLVGYGSDPIDRTSEERLVKGFRQVASAPFQSLTPESLVLQATPEATGAGFVCTGDSGGPQFLAETNLAVSLVGGITNSGSPCGTGARFMQRLDTPVVREFLAAFIDLP